MKYILIILLFGSTNEISAQVDRFNNVFIKGQYLSKDSSTYSGLLKVYLTQKGKLKFKSDTNAKTKKLAPNEIYGFKIDTIEFKSLTNVEVYGAFGKTKKVKSCFGEIVTKGEVDGYIVYFGDYNAISGDNQIYLNLLIEFENNQISIPLYHRIKKKKFVQVKELIKSFFKNKTSVIASIESMGRENGFGEMIEIVRSINNIQE